MPSRAIHLALIALALVFALQLSRGVRAFWIERRDFIPRRWTVPAPDDSVAMGLRFVRFASRDGTTMAGWLIPSRNGAAITLSQGSGSDRSAMLADARALGGAGFGVLFFDWPGHGESEGRTRYGRPERDALQGALDFLAVQPGVDSARLGALGFSMGGYTVSQVAAIDARLRAVVLGGSFDDPVVQTRGEYSRSGPVAVWGAFLALRMYGMQIAEMRPVDVVAQISPRPLLVISGSADAVVPTALSRRLFDAAREPKEFWVIEGAGHGAYGTVDEMYYERLIAFFTRTIGVTATDSLGLEPASE